MWVSASPINGSVTDIMWLDGDTILLLTDEDTLFRSVDGGSTWVAQAEAVESATGESRGGGRVIAWHRCATTGVVLLVGAGNSSVLTRDRGASYSAVRAAEGRRLGGFGLHPLDPAKLLASSLSASCLSGAASGADEVGVCSRTLLASTDAGTTWAVLDDFVLQVRVYALNSSQTPPPPTPPPHPRVCCAVRMDSRFMRVIFRCSFRVPRHDIS